MLIQITPVIEEFPRPRAICREETDDPDYFYAGIERGDESYCFFQYTLSGRGTFTVNGQVHPVTPGKGFLCQVADPLYTYGYPPDATQPWSFVYVQLAGESTRLMVESLVRRFGYVYDLPRDRGSIQRYLQWLDTGHNVFSASTAMGVVTDLFSELMASKEAGLSVHRESHLIRSAMDVIAKRASDLLTATALAEELKVSREYLSRVFGKHLGKSPYRYILEYKVANAQWRLRHTMDSIKEIAFANGFSSPEHFCKVFRSIKGIPPSRCRKS